MASQMDANTVASVEHSSSLSLTLTHTTFLGVLGPTARRSIICNPNGGSKPLQEHRDREKKAYGIHTTKRMNLILYMSVLRERSQVSK
ncbi:unnamed protein product, partial [Musa hybrid cultivar]